MANKEAIARIKINKLLETTGWRFFPEGSAPANIRLEPSVTIKSSDLDALGENFEKTTKGFIDFLLLDTKGFPLIVLEAKSEDKNPLVGKAMPRRYRNRRIGEFLKELEFTEGRSTGIPKIIDAMQANGSPPAEFDFDEDHSYFMVRLPVHPAALAVADLVVGESAYAYTPQVTPQVSRLLEVLIGDMSRAEIMNALALKDRMHFANDYLRPALEEDLIRYTIPDKPNSRLQRYRLTEKGRAVLASLERLMRSE
jgi:hypothetical protein